MPRVRLSLVVLLAAALAAGGAALRAQSDQSKSKSKPAPPAKAADAAQKKAPAKAAAAKHVVLNASDMQWGPGPDSLPPGAQMSVLDGDPGKAGSPFVIRAKLPDGYKVPPHWHPSAENVTVISGSLVVGMGDKWDDTTTTTLKDGAFAKLPRNMHHYAGAKGETILQIHAIGPFGITYVNPTDDPRKKTQ
jgi:quercetin dioxygenase-like cupin family protein